MPMGSCGAEMGERGAGHWGLNPGPQPSAWGGAGPPGTSHARLRYTRGSGDARCPRGLRPPPFLQPRVPLGAGCSLPAAAGAELSGGHRGVRVPPTPVHVPGDPVHVSTALVSPWPQCVPLWPHCASPQPLAMSPPAPPCVSPCPLHVPTAPCLSLPQPCGTGMWGGGRTRRHPGGQVAPKGLGSTQIGGSLRSPPPSPGPRIFLHAPTSAHGADWQGGHPRCFGAGSPLCSWA